MPHPCKLRLALSLLFTVTALAAPIPVRHRQGATRGFLLIRSQTRAILGYGEYSELAKGDRVTGRLTLHFRDGSIDEETTVFTQNSVFHLISDHHIQRGPFFAKPLDMDLQQDGEITLRTREKDGPVKVETSHVDPHAGLANGLISLCLLNVPPSTPTIKLEMVVPYGNGRLIQLAISPEGEQRFSCVQGFACKAMVFRIKPELGGITGIVAPLIGRQPPDLFVWIREGDVPMVIREVGQLAEGGPTVSLELAGAIFPRSTVE